MQIKNRIGWITGMKSKRKSAIIIESSEQSFPASDPLAFPECVSRTTLKITGSEEIDIIETNDQKKPHIPIKTIIHKNDNTQIEVDLISRIDTFNELDYYKNGGILQYPLRPMLKITRKPWA